MRDRRPKRMNKREAVFSKFGKRDDRRSDRPRLEMFDVVCDSCGKNTQVPFKPSGDKPVYCRDCFRKDGPQKGRDDYSQDALAQINRKLDRIMRALRIE